MRRLSTLATAAAAALSIAAAPYPTIGLAPIGQAPTGQMPIAQAPIAQAPIVPAPFAQAPTHSDSLGADWAPQQDQARSGVKAGRYVPLSQVVATVARRTPGRLLDAGIEDDGAGREVYRVRWSATAGRRLDVIVDAATGAVLREEGR